MNTIKTAFIGAATACLLSAPAQADLKEITIGSNPSGSVAYMLSSGFSKLFQEELGIRSNAQPYSGSSVYLPSIAVGEVTLGISTTVDAGLAYAGKAAFPKELDNLRVLAKVWNISYSFVTQADSGIMTADDLAGKRIMGEIPAAQSLTIINEALLASGGLSRDDVTFLTSGGLMDGIKAVVEGRADAAPVATTMPVLVEANASVDGGLRIVGYGKDGSAEFFSDRVAGLSAGVAKETKKRPHIIGDTKVLSYDAMLVGSDALSDEDAYELTKTLYENWKELQGDIGPIRGVAQEALAIQNPPIPYHPGSIRFFKEIGLWSDAHQANQDGF